MLFPFTACTHERAHACAYVHPLLLWCHGSWVHTSRAVSTILKGSCRSRTFPTGRNREQLTPRRIFRLFLLQRFPIFPPVFIPSLSLSSFISLLHTYYSISFTPISAFRRGNQCGEYVHMGRVCLPSKRWRETRARGEIREVGKMEEQNGRRRRQLEATETSCIPGH